MANYHKPVMIAGMREEVSKYLADIGRRGGIKSRRVLEAGTARDMVRVREARRAFKRFYSSCFWSYNPKYVVTLTDVPWIVEQLQKNGGRAAWEAAAKLCR